MKLAGGTLYDPAHGIDGQVGDLWIEAGKIVAPPSDPAVRPTREIDLRGYVVMPGGIDMHCHIAGPKVNTGRKLRPEEKRSSEPILRTETLRSGTMGSVPSTFATAYKYLGMGYTTAFDAAVPPLTARHAHEEFLDFESIDRGFYVLVGNNQFAMRAIRDGDERRLDNFLAWLLKATRGYALKLVNPGGVEVWKSRSQGNVQGIDDRVPAFDVTPRQILRGITESANRLGLPHPVHIHANELGMPGNWRTTLETMRSLDGLRAHLTHIQFHSYAGGDADETTFGSAVPELAEYVNSHPELSVDVGQVLFGPTTSMTGDGPLGYYLGRLYGTKWFSGDTEMEAGCGIAPIEYRNSSLVHALQWAIGLEWYLLVDDPWRIAMSTDHPNGGSFLAYPHIIRLLMDQSFRREVIATLPPAVAERCVLPQLTREYSLYEICIITRSGPARMLGLENKGHLGPGADADVTVYLPNDDRQRMFEMPRYVIQAGVVVVDDGELVDSHRAATLCSEADYDPSIEQQVSDWFESDYSVRYRNYLIDDHEIPRLKTVSASRPMP
ncbi:MAG: formylmethanofuran dehydrogenase subunit A [Pirellulaceae bacterium]